MTRLPRFLFGGEPALGLVVHELGRQTRHKLGNIGKLEESIHPKWWSEDRRDPI
jgi:hypothetical protein